MRLFAPQGRYVALMRVKFGLEDGTKAVPNFTPIGATIRVYDPQN